MSSTVRKRLALLLFLPLLALGCASAPPQGWQKVGGPLRNVSGMAVVDRDGGGGGAGADAAVEFLVAHDNKKPDEPHVSSVVFDWRTGVHVHTLAWPSSVAPPVDLESICPLPGTPGSFMALTSAGRLLHLRYAPDAGDAHRLEVLHESMLPGLDHHPNVEGFAVQGLGGTSVAIWAERGDGKKPATLYWGSYDAVADTVALQGHAQVFVPYPSGRNTRHVTDLRLDDAGVVWSAVASDPGDEGPFTSAVYVIGTMHVNGGTVEFQPARAMTPLWTSHRKIEAIEFVPGPGGRVYFGADDENAGGWIYVGRRGR